MDKKVVKLVTTDKEKAVTREFPIDQANALLKLPKSKWKLAEDSGYILNDSGDLAEANSKTEKK